MKEGWTYKKLGELCRIRTGKLDANAANENGKYPFFSCSVATLRINSYAYDCECVLIAGNGDLNVKYYHGKFNAYQRTYIIESNDTNFLDVKYLFVFLSEYISVLRKKSIGAIIKYIKIGYLTDAIIPIPPLSEQQRIVARLDAAFAHIDELKANAEKQLGEARTLFQKALTKAMEPKEGWEEKTLGNTAYVFSGYAFKSGAFHKEGKYQVLRIGNIKQNHLRLSDNAIFIDDLDCGLLKKSLLKQGDLVVTQTGTRHKRDYGYVAMVEKENLLLNQRNACIRFDNKLFAQFFLYYSYTELYKDRFFANEGGTVGQGNVGLSALKEMNYYAPPLSEQQRIVARLDSLSEKVRKYEEIQKKVIAECDNLKQALLRKVFE